jgi:hypothetical protein
MFTGGKAEELEIGVKKMAKEVTEELIDEFHILFGESGGERIPGNVGKSRTVANVCREIMKLDGPVLFEFFQKWDCLVEEESRPFGIERLLANRGQWEGAWALAQLHYDQYLKQESKSELRQHKGHTLCNLALMGQLIGSSSLCRHYALLSSVGDIYWEHENTELKYGGLAPTILERFESYEQHYQWRDIVRQKLSEYDTQKPLYLEAFLSSRWFGDTYLNHICEVERVKRDSGKPFVEVLLDSVESPNGASATVTGTRFEVASAILLSATPGFEVDSARRTTDEQIDIVVNYTPENLSPVGLEAGCGLVECRSSEGRVQAKELRDFGAKCLFHRVKYGILIARTGTTGCDSKYEEPQSAELVRRRFQLDGLTLLVLDIKQLRGASRNLRGVQAGLSSDYKALVFGPIA